VLKLPPGILRDLDFGAPAAERDIGRGLAKYFVESAAFDRVRSGAKTIILGSRGSGKSAIFKVLAARERAAGSRVIELAPEDYSYELLSSTMAAADAGSWAKHGAYAAAWKYLIYVLIMKEVSARGGKAIRKYLHDNHPDPQAGALTPLVSYLKRLENIKIGPIEAGFKSRELDRLYKLEEIHRLLPQLTEVLARQRVVVLVDELDRGWDSSEDAKAFVSGLFQACVSMNEIHPGLRVYVSLRQELYDDIPALYEDAQKYRDLLEMISWTEDSLLKLIARRIRHCAAEAGYNPQALAQASDASWWSSVFATPSGHPVSNSFQYMVDRTLHRPREIILFCAQALEKARERAATLPLPYAAVSWAERGFSAERAQDIAAEYRFQYPGLLAVFDAFRRRPETLGRDELELLCLELATGDIPAAGTSAWLSDRDPASIIEILWHVGFLTAQPATQARSRHPNGTPFLGAHQMRHLNLGAVRDFQVHPMFRGYLDITTQPRRQAVTAQAGRNDRATRARQRPHAKGRASLPSPPAARHPAIFICYRREDAASDVARLRADLQRQHFSVFQDLDSVALGARFFAVCQSEIKNCDTQLVVIGRHWLATQGPHGRRLDDPADFVRQEIEIGLGAGIRVIPVLVGAATMPRRTNCRHPSLSSRHCMPSSFPINGGMRQSRS
jgi:TIR domain